MALETKKGVSIVICCYNSAERLVETIKHIACQQISEEIAWELIVVNNNSTDNTKEVALTEINKYPNLVPRSVIVDEASPGLSQARQKGVHTAKNEYVIFCDDDNWLDKNYVETAFHILHNNLNIAACGGQSEAVSDIEFPDWFEDYKSGYAVGQQGAVTGDISQRKYLWGSGLAFKKSLYVKAFEKVPSLLTDRKGSELSSGGDAEICMRFLLMGYELYYDTRLQFKHFISKERLTWAYRKKLFDGFDQSSSILDVYSQFIDVINSSFREKIKCLFKNTAKIILSFLPGKKTFYTANEANFIYFLSGIHLTKTSVTAKLLKNDIYTKNCRF